MACFVMPFFLFHRVKIIFQTSPPSAKVLDDPIEHSVTKNLVRPHHRLCTKANQITCAWTAFRYCLANRFRNQFRLGKHTSTIIFNHTIGCLICHFCICTIRRSLFQVFSCDNTPVRSDSAGFYDNNINVEWFQFHSQAIRESLHCEFCCVISAAEFCPDLTTNRGDIDDFSIMIFSHGWRDKLNKPSHAEKIDLKLSACFF